MSLHRIPSLVIASHLRTQINPTGVRLCSVFECVCVFVSQKITTRSDNQEG